MPEINGSIPASVAVPQNDLWGTVGKAIAVKQGLLQNQMLQQDFGARQAVGDAYQAAIDPQTGELNTNLLLSTISRDPRGAYRAGEVAKDALERARGQAMLSQEQFGVHKSVIEATTGAMDGLLAQAKPLTGNGGPMAVSKAQIFETAGRLLADPSFSPEARKALIGNVTNFLGSVTDDPVKNYQLLQQLHMQRLTGIEAQNAAYGTPTTVNTGGQTSIVAPSAMTGRAPVLATMQNTLTPGEGAQRVQTYVKDANGNFVPVSIPQSQAAQIGQLQTGPALTPGGLTPAEASERVPSFDPVTHQPITVPKGSVEFRGAGAPAGGGSGALPSGPALGQAEALAAQGAASAKQGTDLQARADLAPDRMAALTTMNDLVGRFSAGPAADQLSKMGALAAQFGLAPPDSKKATSAKEEFDKLSTQIIVQQTAQLGAGTDAKLDAGLKSNPSSYLSSMGAKNVLALMRGNENAIASKNEAWQKWLASGKTPDSYGQFSAQFNRLYDPRVFQSQYMSPADREAMLKNMTPAEKKAFTDHARIAVQAGWIK